MQRRLQIQSLILLPILAIAVAGCSKHDTPPATPVDSAKTPTFRSSANSYDQPNTPLHTQPGVDHGQATTLPAIPKVNRFDQNSPLAEQVYNSIQAQLGRSKSNYITVQTKGSTVMLGGTTPDKASKDQAEAIAKKTSGVQSVDDTIKVQAQ